MTVNIPVATIHLDNIRANYEYARTLAPNSKCMPVIKANAYGHGMGEVASVLYDADAFAVSRVEEAVKLRQIQPDKLIVVLEGFLNQSELDLCIHHHIIPFIHSEYQLARLPEKLPYWLKFNTGMFRLGFSMEDAEALSKRVPQTSLLGICSHFANSDQPDNARNVEQMNQFDVIASRFPDVPQCIANSGAVIGLAASHRDWTRPGIMLYGGSPDGVINENLKPGMTLRAPVLAVDQVKEGDSIGYGSTWTANEKSRVAIVALGYADGYPREMPTGTPVLVSGQRRQLVGRVSMDMCAVLLKDQDELNPGDWVTFWGEALPIDEIASQLGTISYTLTTGVRSRVKRDFRGGR